MSDPVMTEAAWAVAGASTGAGGVWAALRTKIASLGRRHDDWAKEGREKLSAHEARLAVHETRVSLNEAAVKRAQDDIAALRALVAGLADTSTETRDNVIRIASKLEVDLESTKPGYRRPRQ